MADETKVYSIVVQASQAQRTMARMAAATDALGTATGRTDTELRRVDRQLEKNANTLASSAATLAKLKNEYKSLSKELTAATNANGKLSTQLSTANRKIDEQKASIAAQKQIIRELIAQQSKLRDAYRQTGDASKASADKLKQNANILNGLQKQFNAAKPLGVNSQGVITKGGTTSLAAIAAAQNANAAATTKSAAATKAHATATSQLEENQVALRYALYSTAATFGILAAAGVKAYGDLFKTGIDFEKNFANVIRTSQVSNPEVFNNNPLVTGDFATKAQVAARATEELRQKFLDLQTTLPITSEDLATIGTLGAQMGVTADKLAGFTEITGKFSATAGISADEAATALARVAAITSKGQPTLKYYDQLASSILKTGVNAIATEQQIVRGVTQIASLGKLAGLTTDEIVALSSAMSSLGLSPELQRSVITSSFTKILTAVRGASSEAEKFGRVMGISGAEFQKAFTEDAYGTYQKLLATIAKSPQAIGILEELGLASQRLTPNLLKIGQSYELLSQTRADARKGWEDDNELTRQYGEISKTTAAKLQILSQTWDKFLTIVGSSAVEGLGKVAQIMGTFIDQLSEVAKNPVGGALLNFVGALGLLATAGLAVLSGLALLGAGFFGVNYALQQFGVAGGIAGIRAQFLGTQVQIAGVKATGAAAAFGVMRSAVRLLSVATGALLAFDLLGFIGKTKAAAEGLNDLGTDQQIAKTKKFFSEFQSKGALSFLNGKKGDLSGFNAFDASVNRAFKDINSLDSNNFYAQAARADEAIAKLANSGHAQKAGKELLDLRKQFIAQGGKSDVFKALFTDSFDALSLVTDGAGRSADAIRKYVDGQQEAETESDALAVSQAFLASQLSSNSDRMGEATDQIKAYSDAFKSGAEGFFDLGSLFGDNYKGIVPLQKNLDDSLKAFGTWRDGIQELTARGAGDFAQAVAAQGPDSQKAITDALKLGPDALAQLNQSFADAAFFASDAYATAFASDNGQLAAAYKRVFDVDPSVATNALHDFRDLLKGGLTAKEISDFQIKYNVTLDPDVTGVSEADIQRAKDTAQVVASAKPVEIPVSFKSPSGETVYNTVQGYQVQFGGYSVTLDVDPNTEEGQRQIQEFLDYVNGSKGTPKIDANTDDGKRKINDLINGANTRTAAITVTANTSLASAAINTLSEKARNINAIITAPKPKKDGGPMGIQRFANGGSPSGVVHGPGGPRDDRVLALLSNTEYVMQARAHKFYGTDMMNAINNLRFPRFANGGTPGGPQSGAGGGNVTNVNATVIQNNPVTRDPIRQLKDDTQNMIAGIWV